MAGSLEKIATLIVEKDTELVVTSVKGLGFYYEETSHAYRAGGRGRSVFVDHFSTYVLKFARLNEREKNDLAMVREVDYQILPRGLRENFLDDKLYKECPPELKVHLAQTELLPNGVLKQEFCRQERISQSTFGIVYGEIGVNSQGFLVLCDFDILTEDYKPESGFDWKRILIVLKKAQAYIKKRNGITIPIHPSEFDWN